MADFDEDELLADIEEFSEFDAEFEEEHFFVCPYCWQKVSMVLDLSVTNQEYIEDCEVCCQPVQISYAAEDFQLISFEADILE